MKCCIEIVVPLLLLSLCCACTPQPGTYRRPDFQTSKIYLSADDLHAVIQNSGAQPYSGDLAVRILVMGELFGGVAVDQTAILPVDLGPGERQDFLLLADLASSDMWPDRLDYPQKVCGIKLDSTNQVVELNENNNLSEVVLRVPCGAAITSVTPTFIDYTEFGHPYSLTLQGTFGTEQGPKNIVLQTRDGNKGIRFQDVEWSASEITVEARNIQFFPGQCMELFVECTEPDGGQGYFTSNKKTVCMHDATDPVDPGNACPQPIDIPGFQYAGIPRDCYSEYLLRHGTIHCDANGWYCCINDVDSDTSERCGPDHLEITPTCCGYAEMTCDEVLKQPYGCYERQD